MIPELSETKVKSLYRNWGNCPGTGEKGSPTVCQITKISSWATKWYLDILKLYKICVPTIYDMNEGNIICWSYDVFFMGCPGTGEITVPGCFS